MDRHGIVPPSTLIDTTSTVDHLRSLTLKDIYKYVSSSQETKEDEKPSYNSFMTAKPSLSNQGIKSIFDKLCIGDNIIVDSSHCEPLIGKILNFNRDRSAFRLKSPIRLVDGETVTCNPLVRYGHIKRISILSPSNESLSELQAISLSELVEIISLSTSYEMFREYTASYKDAIEDLQGLTFVGFMAENTDSRYQRLHILAMCSMTNIYFFDILSMGCIPKELRDILESDEIQKLTLDSHTLGDSLYQNYEVKMKGVFDLQIMHNYAVFLETGKQPSTYLTYNDLIEKYFKIPADLFYEKPIFSSFGCVRPLSDKFLKQMARNISFLQNLSIRLHDKILNPVFEASAKRANFNLAEMKKKEEESSE